MGVYANQCVVLQREVDGRDIGEEPTVKSPGLAGALSPHEIHRTDRDPQSQQHEEGDDTGTAYPSSLAALPPLALFSFFRTA